MENKFLIQLSDNSKQYSIIPETIATETVIPTMTSNTTPSGRAFASSNEVNSASGAWRAFDRTDSGYVSASDSATGYLGYEFMNPILIGKYVITSFNSSSALKASPKDWTFEGSNDGINWTILDAQVNQTWTTINTKKEYVLDIGKIGIYKMYRLNWTANNGELYTALNEFIMYEYKPGIITSLPKSEENFINYGMDKDISINLSHSKISERRYVVQDSETLGSGKVFKQKIDTLKIPIKNVVIT